MRIGYARVSTTKATQDVSIEGQVQQLEAAGCHRVIAERASAYQGRRAGWDELWGLVAAGGVAEVLVIDQSRLSRSGDDLQFLAACAQQGVTVRALTGGVIEAETYSWFVAAGVLSVMNQAQSKLIGAKVRDGIRRRREAGYLASGRLPFGYCSVNGKAAPDPDGWPQARAQFDELMAAVTSRVKKISEPLRPRFFEAPARKPPVAETSDVSSLAVMDISPLVPLLA